MKNRIRGDKILTNHLFKYRIQRPECPFHEIAFSIEQAFLRKDPVDVLFRNFSNFLPSDYRECIYLKPLPCSFPRTFDEILAFKPLPGISFKCHGIASSEPAALFQPDLLVRIIRLVRIQIFSLAFFNHFLHDETN